jgi:hypothetical protein
MNAYLELLIAQAALRSLLLDQSTQDDLDGFLAA